MPLQREVAAAENRLTGIRILTSPRAAGYILA